MKKELDLLKQLLQEASDLEAVAALLGWDQSTYMPPEGAAARGQQLAKSHQGYTPGI